MKLIRFGPAGAEKPGLIDASGKRRDASGVIKTDYDRLAFDAGLLGQLREIDPAALPLVSDNVRWGALIARPGKIIAIGLNYADQAAESGMAVPAEPIVFFKAPHTVVGPYDDVLIPRQPDWLGGGHATKTDWEVELGVVIGRTCRCLADESQAVNYIAGYCISDDVSERHFQLERGGQWVKGKSCDTFNPLGPWLLTPDEAGDVSDLSMKLPVNGQLCQNGNTRTMVQPVVSRPLSKLVHDPGSRRPDHHRHATRCRSRHETASLPSTRRRDGTVDPVARRTTSDVQNGIGVKYQASAGYGLVSVTSENHFTVTPQHCFVR